MATLCSRGAVGLALSLVTACSSSVETKPLQAPAPGPATVAAPTTAPPEAPSAGPIPGTSPRPDDRLTLAFGGDVHFARQLAPLLRGSKGLAELRPHLAGADLAMVNLETAITDRGTPAPKTYHFRSTPAALDVLAEAGVDVVTLANNHALDYGTVGLQDTLGARDASPVPVVGLGRDEADAYAPAVLTVRGPPRRRARRNAGPGLDRPHAWGVG